MKRTPFVLLAAGALSLSAWARADETVDQPVAAPMRVHCAPLAVAPTSPTPGQKIVCVPNQQQQTQQQIKQQPEAPLATAVKPCEPDCSASAVHFDFNSAELTEDGKAILMRSARCLKINPNYKVTIEGAADQSGSTQYNLALGERRAKAVSAFLTAQGVNDSQLIARSVGKDQPVCTDNSAECAAQNRRAALVPSENVASATRIIQ